MGNIVKLCNKNKLELIEDSAETLEQHGTKDTLDHLDLVAFPFSQLKILRLLREECLQLMIKKGTRRLKTNSTWNK